MIHVIAITRQFSKWAAKQKIPKDILATALVEIQTGNFEANLGGHTYKNKDLLRR